MSSKSFEKQKFFLIEKHVTDVCDEFPADSHFLSGDVSFVRDNEREFTDVRNFLHRRMSTKCLPVRGIQQRFQ